METADQAPGAAGDFAIGNLVYVSGTKKGKIAFLGDTRFAAGEWAGVVLDEPVGKNDGSVNGVRYFTCEPMHGIFCKLEKLSPCLEAENFSPPEGAQAASPAQNGYPAAANSGDQISNVPAANISGAMASDNDDTRSEVSNLSFAAHPVAIQSNVPVDFSIGDRVVVSDTKVGYVRFMGETRFAPGAWTGVELEEPRGKNDGSVNGVRYFACRPLFGLFAPTYKVRKLTEELEYELRSGSKLATSKAPRTSIPSLIRASQQDVSAEPLLSLVAGTEAPEGDELGPLGGEMQSNAFGGSRESLLSLGTSSVCSSASRPGASRLKMGTRMPQQPKPGKPSGINTPGKQYKPATHAHNALLSSAGKPSGTYAPAVAAKQAVSTKQMGASASGGKLPGAAKSVSGNDVMSMSMMTAGGGGAGGVTPSSAAFQKVLREKDEHIEALQRELHGEQNELAKQTARVNGLECQLASVHEQVSQLERDKVALSDRVEEEKRRVEQLEFDLAEHEVAGEPCESNDQVENEKKLLDIELRNAKEALQLAESRSDEFKLLLDEARSSLKDARDSCEAYLDEINQLRANLASKAADPVPTSDTLASVLVAAAPTDQTPEVLATPCRCAELSDRVAELELRLRNSEHELSEYVEKKRALEKESSELKAENANLQEELTNTKVKLNESIEQRASEAQRRNEAERTRIALKAELDELRLRYESLLERSKNDSNNMTCNTSSANANQSSINSTVNNNGLEHDPAFCNSVIADLKNKLDRLTTENEQLRKAKLDTLIGSSDAEPKTKRSQAPRTYCDVCELFDAHDTENCPNSSNADLENRKPFVPTPAGRRLSQQAPRLYCDTCEKFGHSAAECPERSA